MKQELKIFLDKKAKSQSIIFDEFEIRKPTYLGETPKGAEYNYDIVKWVYKEGSNNPSQTTQPFCYSIAFLKYNPKEADYEFVSVGSRYLRYRKDGLEDFILAFIEVALRQIKNEEN